MQPNQIQAPPRPYQPYTQQQYREEQQQMLASVVQNAQEVLYQADTVFPFTLFVDSIVVDREKVTITHRSFFKVGEVVTLHIDDILNVTANVGPFLGSLKLTMRFADAKSQPDADLHYLSRKNALNLQRIIHGYSTARQQGVDCAQLPKDHLVHMLLSLGSGGAPTTAAP